MGKIFYIMGKSASGKDRIYSRLAGDKNLNFKKLILYTTRPRRDGEEDGVQYYFSDDKKLKEFSNQYAKQMSVKMVNVDQFVSDLSGGNKQKVVLARWIGKDSDIVVLDSPTRGIDIKVKQDIYQLMNKMRKNGKSIIMISEELMELIGMCDRIVIMKDGEISGELERSQNLDENSLITMMV